MLYVWDGVTWLVIIIIIIKNNLSNQSELKSIERRTSFSVFCKHERPAPVNSEIYCT